MVILHLDRDAFGEAFFHAEVFSDEDSKNYSRAAGDELAGAIKSVLWYPDDITFC
ncbi:MAG: hypothetical protein J6V88_05775 [Kiritimatiellae bacterium]|nr:hypothetical protein [Kiritimatiellia bacterium]